VLSKLFGCGHGALGTGRANVLRIGVGMIPRGEVGMVVAQIGRSLGVVSETAYGIVVFMSVMTTIIAPPLLNITYRGLMRPDQKSEDMIRIG
ncbi:MAG: cation:proton antiporter, partial [Bryobacteraceae bacterium]